jgi:NADH-quinone oxidoreductase subunit K
VAACEAGVALALFLMLYRRKRSLDVSQWQALREPGVPETIDTEPLPPTTPDEPLPHLPAAGVEPGRREERQYV